MAVILVSGLFFGLAGLFMLAPSLGARVYGIPASSADALLFVRAIGFRDFALAAYLLGLALAGTWRTLAIVLAITTVIPIGDLFLLTTATPAMLVPILLHGASLLCLAGLAGWCLLARTGS